MIYKIYIKNKGANMMKKILSLLLSLITIFMFGCGNSNIKTKDEIKTEEKISINLGLPKAAPALAVLQMIETNAMGDDVEINIDYWDSPEQLIAMTQDEEHDMFALPLLLQENCITRVLI